VLVQWPGPRRVAPVVKHAGEVVKAHRRIIML
jgi:hypothetical protein